MMQYLASVLILASALTSVLSMTERFQTSLDNGFRITIERDVPLEIVPRDQWGAVSPLEVIPLTLPVPYVIIHHTVSPAACYTTATCLAAMKAIQVFHMGTYGWDDIGYNFGIGSDGKVYEGRGWSTVGTHAAGYNSRSLGIAVIGNWANAIPAEPAFEALEELIAVGIAQGYISKDYVLWGHSQAATIRCPAVSLFDALVRFPLFDPTYPFNLVHSVLTTV